jgi:hypothetical protein
MWFVTICIATWLLGAALCFLLSPLVGIPTLIFALLLTEALLSAHRSEQTPIGDRKPLGE